MLLPKKEGKLTIPPIQAVYKNETAKSDEIIIKVVKDQTEAGQTRSFFSTVALSQDTVYVGQQLVYTLKFFNSAFFIMTRKVE